MLTSFKSNLAKRMTRQTKGIMSSPWYNDLFPKTQISNEQNEKHYFETTSRGHYYSAAMSSVTGEGCDIQICDDPLNPEEAASTVQRQNAIDTIRGTLFSRFNDPRTGRFILIMQRLHEDDPTGDLLKDEGWEHLKLPAVAQNKTYSYALRNNEWTLEKGELLFPERFTEEVLAEKAVDLGPYNYAGQYLQEPAPLEGGEIKKDYINFYSVRDFDASKSNVCIVVDPAKGDENAIKNDHDYTAMAVWALAPDQNYYLLDGVKERLNPTERIEKLFELHRKWNEKTGKPPRVGYEDIGMQADMHFIKKKMEYESYRFSITPLPPKGQKRLSKVQKIRRLIPEMQRHRIWLPNDIWYKDHRGLQQNFMNDIIETEMLLFPFAPHDDFIDAMSMVFDMGMSFPKMGSQQRSDGLGWFDEPESVFDI
jgi:predicted phage terminase large subunit-like protein